MTTIDLTATDLIELAARKTVDLRKLAGQAGLKGMSSARKEDLINALVALQAEQVAEKAKVVPKPVRKGMCDVCGKRRAAKFNNGQCEPCAEEGAWENTHNDDDHGTEAFTGVPSDTDPCWICHPELNLAQREVITRTSKAGMEIKAKGNKAEVFKAAAEAKGFTVTIQVETYEGGNTRTYATAVFGGIKGEHIVLAWVGSAYDYPNSEASKDGKVRKVRNLSEALRLLDR